MVVGSVGVCRAVTSALVVIVAVEGSGWSWCCLRAAEHCAMRMKHSVAASAIVSVRLLAEPVRIGDAIHFPERLPRRRSLVDGSGGGGWERAAQWYATS